MGGLDIPLHVIREQIASAVDLIVQQSRMKDGTRKVTNVTEVAGMEGQTIVMTDIYKFEQTGISEESEILGSLKPTGMRPMFSDRLEASGFRLGADVFGVTAPIAADRSRRRKR
jgi:pilus assembly protein CpaF